MARATLVLFACAPQRASGGNPPIYLDASQPLEARVEDLLSRMSLEEKAAYLHGDLIQHPKAPEERHVYRKPPQKLNSRAPAGRHEFAAKACSPLGNIAGAS